jgi:hypothetical protein
MKLAVPEHGFYVFQAAALGFRDESESEEEGLHVHQPINLHGSAGSQQVN